MESDPIETPSDPQIPPHEEEKADPDKISKTQVYAWGNGKGGNLGNGSEDYEPLPFAVTGALKGKKIVKIQCGEWFCAALSDQGALYAWGKASRNRFGMGKIEAVMTPTKLPLKFKITNFSCGYWHTLVVNTNGDVFSVGDNKRGGCGHSGVKELTEFTKIEGLNNICKVAAGSGFSLFVDNSGVIYSCGRKEVNGHLAKLGDVYAPAPISAFISKPDSIAYIDAGVDHAAAITEEGELYTWGSNVFKQLGNTSKSALKTPKKVDTLSDVKVVQVSCSKGLKHCHTACVDSAGKAYFWGCGYKGKLGNVENWNHDRDCDESEPKQLQFEPAIAHAESGGIHSSIIDTDGVLYTFGCGSHGRLGHQRYIDGKYRHLYKESQPKRVEFFDTIGKVVDYSSTYSSNVALVELF